MPLCSPFPGSRTRLRICASLSSTTDIRTDTDYRDDRFLEDFVNLVDYRPLASKGGKKQDDEDLVADREEYVSAGLDERAMTAVRAISRSDRIDYAVSS